MEITLRELSLEERKPIEMWADYLKGAKYWGEDVCSILKELDETELRICAMFPNDPEPVAFASVTRHCKEYPYQDGQLWLDHLYVAERARKARLVEPLYERQMVYVRHSQGRIFRLPASERIVNFSLKRGWRYHADVPGFPFPVYELPRECVG